MADLPQWFVQDAMHILITLAAAAAAPHPAPIDRSSAEHYVWGEVNDGWHLVKRDDMSVITERIAPGSSEMKGQLGQSSRLSSAR